MLSGRAFFCSQEVTHEIDVPSDWNSLEWLTRLVESNVFFDKVSIRQFHTLDELLFSPAIETVTNAGLSLQTRNALLSLAIEKRLGLLVVRIDHHRKIEAEPSFDVFGA